MLVSDAVGKNQGVQGRLRFKCAAVLFLANFREHSKTQLDCEYNWWILTSWVSSSWKHFLSFGFKSLMSSLADILVADRAT